MRPDSASPASATSASGSPDSVRSDSKTSGSPETHRDEAVDRRDAEPNDGARAVVVHPDPDGSPMPSDDHEAGENETPSEAARATSRATDEELNEGDIDRPFFIAVVYNPVKVNLPVLKSAVAAAEKASGAAESLWIETSVDDPGIGQAKEAIERGASTVLAAGGDGTVRAVAEGLKDTGVPLALFPAGTGNLLARNLGLRLDRSDEAVSTAFTGYDRAIDTGLATFERQDGSRDSHVFLIVAGIGLDAAMIENTSSKLKKRVGWLAYIDGIFRSLRGSSHVRMRYRIDDRPLAVAHMHSFMVGNCGALPGNVTLLPDAQIDDGLLDMVALRPSGFWGWLQITFKVAWEGGLLHRTEVGKKIASMAGDIRTLLYLRGREVKFRLDKPTSCEIDGEPMGEIVAMHGVAEPGSLIVKMPQHKKRKLFPHLGGR